MTENANKIPAAQNAIDDPPEYSKAAPSKNWLGGPQNGNEALGNSTEGAYQQNGQSWLGGPQNGNEVPGNGGNGGNGGGNGGKGGNG